MIVLVLGGVRSGKSEVAERLAGDLGETVTYLATATVDPGDSDHAERIERHRRRRPTTWTVVEAGAELAAALRATADDPVLVDSLGTWVTAHEDLRVDVEDLIEALRARSGPTVLVSEEVGLSVQPPTELGRRFQDVLGTVNRAVADVSDRVVLVVAGRTLELT